MQTGEGQQAREREKERAIKMQDDRWKVASGKWKVEDGRQAAAATSEMKMWFEKWQQNW